MDKNFIRTVEYYRKGAFLTAYVTVAEKTTGYAVMNGKIFHDTGNRKEPYDFRLYMFDFNEAELRQAGSFEVVVTGRKTTPAEHLPDLPGELHETITFREDAIISPETALKRSVRNLKFSKVEDRNEYDGLSWTRELYLTEKGEPVRVFTAVADLNRTEIIAGTPNADPVCKPYVIQTVMGEVEAVEKQGKRVLCATNADFFDFYGDGHPSGLCISNGTTVTNPDPDDVFFGITTDGKPVIGISGETDLSTIKEAVSGRELLVDKGRIADTSPLQPFGDVHHPRTAFGIDAENRVIIMVVDSRRPQWSNGVSLTEFAMLMIDKGAVKAMNADGGGSSTFIIRDEKPVMINHPADLERPMEDLIRELFDSLIVVAR